MSGIPGWVTWFGTARPDDRGIVTDVLGGAEWVLRPESGPGQWNSRRPERLTLVTPRASVRERS
ncbi:hypothetical protein [Streptomyces rimosus]|uniref:hypothetical protein n=1 Tax=Streptomyces rimosus TaxID=1927 RepID=UPI0037D453B9